MSFEFKFDNCALENHKIRILMIFIYFICKMNYVKMYKYKYQTEISS